MLHALVIMARHLVNSCPDLIMACPDSFMVVLEFDRRCPWKTSPARIPNSLPQLNAPRRLEPATIRKSELSEVLPKLFTSCWALLDRVNSPCWRRRPRGLSKLLSIPRSGRWALASQPNLV